MLTRVDATDDLAQVVLDSDGHSRGGHMLSVAGVEFASSMQLACAEDDGVVAFLSVVA